MTLKYLGMISDMIAAQASLCHCSCSDFSDYPDDIERGLELDVMELTDDLVRNDLVADTVLMEIL